MQAQHEGHFSPLWPLGPQFPGERDRPRAHTRALLRLGAPPPTLPLTNLAGTAREPVLCALGRQGLRCLRSSCRAGRAAANTRVASARMRPAPLPPNLPNLRHVDFWSLYAPGGYDEDEDVAHSAALGAAVAGLPNSVVSVEAHAAGSPPLLAALGARRGLQSFGFESDGPDCVQVLDAVVRGPSLTSLTSLKLKPQGPWAPPLWLLQRVPWQQLQVGRAPPARMRQAPPR
jgi:hypothetical protein